MGKNLKITLEAFGKSKLEKTFTQAETKGKNFDQIIGSMIHGEYHGAEKETQQTILTETDEGTKYIPQVGIETPNAPVDYQPVRLGDIVENHIQPTDFPENHLRISITGDHDVGRY